MKTYSKWHRLVYIFGIIALIAGAIDPLEGSIVISIGSMLIAITTWLTHDLNRMFFLILSGMIITGVFFLFFFSSLGGFGGNSSLSWWWALFILPYPIGWLLSIILLISEAINRPKLQKEG